MPLEINKDIVSYIQACREQGYEDYDIRIPLLDDGWQLADIQRAFAEVKRREDKKLKKKEIISENKTIYKYKNTMTIHLDDEVMKIVEKRAKKNMLTPAEQVEDIIRRSCVNRKNKAGTVTDNVDDNFLKLFSRKTAGRQKKDKSVKW